jgi:hypothetical protein
VDAPAAAQPVWSFGFDDDELGERAPEKGSLDDQADDLAALGRDRSDESGRSLRRRRLPALIEDRVDTSNHGDAGAGKHGVEREWGQRGTGGDDAACLSARAGVTVRSGARLRGYCHDQRKRQPGRHHGDPPDHSSRSGCSRTIDA